MDRPTFAGVVVIILNDHRLGPCITRPYYMQPGATRMPKNYEAVYRCKCREWEGKHADHAQHVAIILTDHLAPLIEHREQAAR